MAFTAFGTKGKETGSKLAPAVGTARPSGQGGLSSAPYASILCHQITTAEGFRGNVKNVLLACVTG